MFLLLETSTMEQGVASDERNLGGEEDLFPCIENTISVGHRPTNTNIKVANRGRSKKVTEQWKREFSKRPSWIDASIALEQVRKGRANGNRFALHTRSVIQRSLFSLGKFVQNNAFVVIAVISICLLICCWGLRYMHVETDIAKLWVTKGGRLEDEMNFLSWVEHHSFNGESLRELGFGGDYQVVIQTAQNEGENLLTKNGLLEHVTLIEQIALYSVSVAGRNWTLSDFCFKPPPPSVDSSSLGAQYMKLVEKIIPCIWISPNDCFWEGSKALGPHPNIETESLGIVKNFLSSLPNAETISWSNINPQYVVDDLSKFVEIGGLKSFFKRAEIGKGYLDRWCIDPLDPECPHESPNRFPYCKYIQKYLDYSHANKIDVLIDPNYEKRKKAAKNDFNLLDIFVKRRKRMVEGKTNDSVQEELIQEFNQTISSNESTFAQASKSIEGRLLNPKIDERIDSEKQESIESSDEKDLCDKYTYSFAKWMQSNPNSWREFLNENELPIFPDYGETLTGGCNGFAKGILSWPRDLIVGGVKNENGKIKSAEALQSVFLIVSPSDLYNRYKDAKYWTESSLNTTTWNKSVADEVLKAWQREFTRKLYNHQWNSKINLENGEEHVHRRIHPLAATSVADMLKEFCKFNYNIIFFGYLLMLLYALQAQMKWERCLLAVNSGMGLAFAGVIIVTFTSLSGLGLATWMGIQFNAATTQIVPFLSLGIGVDNIFMLLHNYHEVVQRVNCNEVGFLMKETGMSVLMASINNILSFSAGIFLPVPALRSFCAQISILLSFNLIAVLTLFPAFISIDLLRRRSNRRDLCCCSVSKRSMNRKSSSIITIEEKSKFSEKITINQKIPGDPFTYSYFSNDGEKVEINSWNLQSLLHRFYIPFIKEKTNKILVIIISLGLFFCGLYGIFRTNYGLEMSDVLPENSPPSAFLKARDNYFSFFPMFAILKGPNIDYARSQQKIENYRSSIAATKFVVKKNNEPSEEYWLHLLRAWLLTLQISLDEALNEGLIDGMTGELVNETLNFTGRSSKLNVNANIAYRLTCSYGNKYNCSGRVGKIHFVDESGTINVESFYNYITAWYNEDNMMYHVAQASFIPRPPRWSIDDRNAGHVPPADPFIYSQIPFYLTNLSSTSATISMIREIRAVCDDFSRQGLPNFPSGIPFTFWEQYLHLSTHLWQSICLIVFAVFCIISIILCNPWAAGIIAMNLALMTVELTGFLGLAGIKLNPISAVTIITALGIGVEFTAHVVLAFLTSLGTRDERMIASIDRVFVPVIHGAISTLLGIVMLAFSEFEFVVKYFFAVMLALIVIGIINGLLLLPVLLSFAGPPCEVEPLDGGNILKLAETEIQQPQEMQTHRRNCSDDSSSVSNMAIENGSTALLLNPELKTSSPTCRASNHARSVSAHLVP